MAAGSFNRIAAVASNTFRESVRERLLYNLVFFALLMMVSGLVMRQLSIHQDERILKDIGLASMEIFGTVIAIFIGVGLVNKEIERRSLYPLLTKPLRRGEFLLGKFAGLSFTLFVNVTIMTLGLYATLMLTVHRADPGLLKAVYGIFLALLLVVGLAILFSVLTSTLIAAICTVSLVLAGRFADVIRDMPEVAPGAPAWLARGIYLVLPNFGDFDLKSAVVYGDPVSWLQLGWMTFYAALYTSVVLLGAYAAFWRRDLK